MAAPAARGPRFAVTESAAEIARFYEEAYSSAPEVARLHASWRALTAQPKADHVERLCQRAGLRHGRVLEIGCGEGALLAELARRGFAPELAGFEISEAAASIARRRGVPGLGTVETFDGASLPLPDRSFDLAVLSHVLEHAAEPGDLAAEAARVAEAVVVEVPLERNLSARREAKRDASRAIGHLRAFDRRAIRALVRDAGMEVTAELMDPLPAAVHSFFASGPAERRRARAKAGIRRVLFGLAPPLAARLFTLHYACAGIPREVRR